MKEVPGTKLCGHVLLFVPRRLRVCAKGGLFGDQATESDPGAVLLAELKRIRGAAGAENHKLHFTNITGKQWVQANNAALEFLEAGADALRTRAKGRFRAALHCKVAVVFYPRDRNPANYGGDRKERRYRYDETILRMSLKGVLNGLYDDSHAVRVQSLVSDGIATHRPLDPERVLLQLTREELVGRSPLRDHAEVSDAADVLPVSSDHKDHDASSADYDHAHFLQLADLFLGAFAYAAYSGTTPERVPPVGSFLEGVKKKSVVMRPVWELLEKVASGQIINSSHRGSFTASEVVLRDGGVSFKPLTGASIEQRARNSGQGSFEF